MALHAQLVSITTGHPFQVVHNCPGGSRSEAMKDVTNIPHVEELIE